MTTATKAKKITVATVKSFIRKNRSNLLIQVCSSFDGMQDMVIESKSGFQPIEARTCYDHRTNTYVQTDQNSSDHMGINGVWFTGRDFCNAFENDLVIGYEVSNCCGSWRIAITK